MSMRRGLAAIGVLALALFAAMAPAAAQNTGVRFVLDFLLQGQQSPFVLGRERGYYAAQKIELWRLQKGDGPMPSIEGGELPVANEEPLKRELADFIAAIRERRAPVVTGAEGRRALSLAQQIANKMSGARAPGSS